MTGSDAPGFATALWAEALKARRSRVPLFTALGMALVPCVGTLFMVILKDPEKARGMGLISAKAQLAAGTADWPAFLGLLTQAVAVGGGFVFAVVATWVFGREHSDHTAKDLLALPTPRGAIIAAKGVLVGLWGFGLLLLVLLLGLPLGALVGMPGASPEVLTRGVLHVLAAGGLTLALMPPVAFVASAGRGYLAPLAWTILTIFVAQVVSALGWGAWCPWAVPALFGGMAGPGQVGPQSYALVAGTSGLGGWALFRWWLRADQTR